MKLKYDEYLGNCGISFNLTSWNMYSLTYYHFLIKTFHYFQEKVKIFLVTYIENTRKNFAKKPGVHIGISHETEGKGNLFAQFVSFSNWIRHRCTAPSENVWKHNDKSNIWKRRVSVKINLLNLFSPSSMSDEQKLKFGYHGYHTWNVTRKYMYRRSSAIFIYTFQNFVFVLTQFHALFLSNFNNNFPDVSRYGS